MRNWGWPVTMSLITTVAVAGITLAATEPFDDAGRGIVLGESTLPLAARSSGDDPSDQTANSPQWNPRTLPERVFHELVVPLTDDAPGRRWLDSGVATATALAPLALADVLVALATNVRMIRSIAQIYGGRAGRLGSWRRLRAVT